MGSRIPDPASPHVIAAVGHCTAHGTLPRIWMPVHQGVRSPVADRFSVSRPTQRRTRNRNEADAPDAAISPRLIWGRRSDLANDDCLESRKMTEATEGVWQQWSS
jgi:hypothetical protein